MKIGTYAFKGETPRLTDNLLTAEDSGEAYNCDMSRGDLRSWREAETDSILADASVLSLNEYAGSFITDTAALDYVRSPIAEDPYARLYYTGKSEPRLHDINNLPATPAYDILGVPAPTYTPIATQSVAGTGTDEQRSYCYTRITSRSEEGPPSPITTVATAKPTGATWLITRIEGIPTNRSITKLNLYRTAVGSDAVAEYVFVKEVTLPTIAVFTSGETTANNGYYYSWTDGGNTLLYKCINNGTTCDPDDAVNGIGGSGTDYWEWYTITDDTDTANLDTGIVCPSEDYLPPPSGLAGLIEAQNGMLAGFYLNNIYFCENWLPHAWPEVEIGVQAQVIGLAKLSDSVIALADSKNYSLIGDTPDTIISLPINGFNKCVAKRGIVTGDDGVYFPSDDGLVRISLGGHMNVTFPYVSKKDWQDLTPSGINGHIFDNKYFGFNPTAGTGFIFDLITKDFTRLNDDFAYAGYVSYTDSKFYIVVYERENPNDITSDFTYKIKAWGEDDINYKRYVWKSKVFQLGSNVNFAAARVLVDDDWYDTVVALAQAGSELETLNQDMIDNLTLGGAIGDDAIGDLPIAGTKLYDIQSLNISDTILFKIYVDGSTTPKFTKSISASGAFVLPAEYKCRKIQYELSGYVPIFSVEIATSMEELNEAA